MSFAEDGADMNLTTDEFNTCLNTISLITQELNADFANIDDLNGLDPNYKSTAKTGQVAHLMIRKRPQSVQDLLEIRVAVVGNVDAGKVHDTHTGTTTDSIIDIHCIVYHVGRTNKGCIG